MQELERRAERAAFVILGQPALPGAKLLLPALPDWIEGCCSQHFAIDPMSGCMLPGTALSNVLERPGDDADVLGLVRFFNDVSGWRIVRWAQGYFDVASVDPRHLLVAPGPMISFVHAVSAPRLIGGTSSSIST
jgi:hypothetical protein